MNIFLIDIIKSFGKEDEQKIFDFLDSPFFNQGVIVPELKALYMAIRQAAPDYSKTQLDSNTIYNAVFPGKPFVEGKLDKLMSDLKKQLRLYALANEYFSEKNEVEQQIAWAAWLRKKNLRERFHQAIDKLKKRKAVESVEEFHILLKIATEEFEWEREHNSFLGDLGIPRLIRQLDLYYFTFRTDLSSRILLQQQVANLSRLEISNKEETDFETSSVLLALLKKLNFLLQKETLNASDFQTFTDLLKNNQSKLPADVLKGYLAFLRSICTMLINNGHLEYVPILHQIHRNSLAEGDLLFDNKIENNSFLNIVQIAIRANEVQWAEDFIEEYKNRIYGGDEDGFIIQYSVASCLFAEGRFVETLDHIPLEPSSTFYQLMTRRLELKAYYELDSELFSYKLDAFRKFIERTAPKSITTNLRKMNLNFIYILTQLIQSPKKDRSRAEKILKRIEEKTVICDRAWLMEKANALK
ncbi:MAG: hypothetical protein ACKVT2_12215 [Saprospiraceae bacterium]